MSVEAKSHGEAAGENENNSEIRTLVRDIEAEITTSFVFNWFIAWPLIAMGFGVLTVVVSRRFVLDKFIDEIFHVTMVEQYVVKGDFKSWDGKITTPAGLYYLGYVWCMLIKLVRLPLGAASLTSLRLLNTAGGVVALPIALNPLFVLNPIGWWLSTLMLFPLLSLFYTLFYTDVWSTVLIMSSLSLAVALPFGDSKSVKLSALLGLVSVWFRQTNIVWNLLTLVLLIERRAMVHKNFTDNSFNNCIKFLIQFFEDFYQFSLPYIINFALFLGFLIYNRGITLGDKENHVAGLHIAQLFYCLTFITVLTWPVWLSYDFVMDYLRRYRYLPILILIEFLAIMILIRYFTVEHPFLLADNRHYTFYIWKRIINFRWYTKYLLTPIYHFSIYTTILVLNENAFYFNSSQELPFKFAKDLPLKPTGISIMTFFTCMCLTIIPSPLFEPRYYIVPYIIYRILVSVPYEPFFPNQSYKNIIIKRLSLEFIWFLLIDILIISIYLFHTFKWDDESAPQRIIW